MKCKHCGAEFHGHPAHCPVCDARLIRKRPPLLIRAVLGLFSLVLSLVLTASLLATALLTDIRLLTSPGGIEDLLTHIVSSEQTTPEPTTTTSPAMGGHVVLLSSTDDVQSSDEEENAGHILLSPDALTDYLHDFASHLLGEDIPITTEQMVTFIEKSTVMDFVAEKASDLVMDILTGEDNTTITADDLIHLLEENAQVIEETFHVEITEEMKQDMANDIHETVGDHDLAADLRNSVDEVMHQPLPGVDGMNLKQLLDAVQHLTHTSLIYVAYGLCLVLMALLCAVYYYNPAKGLRLSSSACISIGFFLSVPVAMLQFFPTLLHTQLPETSEIMHLLTGIATVLAPVHYGFLIFGLVLYVLAAVWRIMRKF